MKKIIKRTSLFLLLAMAIVTTPIFGQEITCGSSGYVDVRPLDYKYNLPADE
ncbi:MAG: hypothetical protein FWC91_13015 [Defluviitaleaceae bacterium]|nr:hypothetical protein [Defluviitaleaceae bacterium]